jgi:hypothetical protein
MHALELEAKKLVKEIKELNDELELKKYLEQQTKIRSEDFFLAGRKNDLPFDKLYQNLIKAEGDQGLSNPEASLAAGLWRACIKFEKPLTGLSIIC